VQLKRKKVAEPFQVNNALGQGSQSGIPSVSEKRIAGLFRPINQGEFARGSQVIEGHAFDLLNNPSPTLVCRPVVAIVIMKRCLLIICAVFRLLPLLPDQVKADDRGYPGRGKHHPHYSNYWAWRRHDRREHLGSRTFPAPAVGCLSLLLAFRLRVSVSGCSQLRI
jgi:hypothetical protein